MNDRTSMEISFMWQFFISSWKCVRALTVFNMCFTRYVIEECDETLQFEEDRILKSCHSKEAKISRNYK